MPTVGFVRLPPTIAYPAAEVVAAGTQLPYRPSRGRPAVPLLAGLDVGTTSAKAVVIDLDGHGRGHGRAPTTWEPAADGAEISAAALLDGARIALQDALAAAPGGEVLGLGVASMAESGVLLGRDGSVLGPIIAWHDTRDAGEVAEARAALGADEYALRTGLPLRPQWSLTKHRWLMTHAPAAAGAARRLNIAEWIVRRLGGDEVSEPSLASRTGWASGPVSSRPWSRRARPWAMAPQPMLELTRAGITVGWHAQPGNWCLLGATEGGLVLQRALRRLGVSPADGLTLDTEAWRATLADGAAQARALHDAMSRVAGEHGQLIAVGGWLRSAAFVAVKRQFFGPVRRPVVDEAGARGAALLAGVAAGAYPDVSRLPAPAMEQL